MSRPTNRDEFKEWCLTKLGWPVIDINVDDDQVDDRIDEAIDYFQEYDKDSMILTYMKHQVDANNIANGWIPIDDNVVGVKRIFPLSTSSQTSSSNLFDYRYQMKLNDMYTFSTFGMQATSYYITRSHLAMLNQIFTGVDPVRFNRHMNRLYVDMDWTAKVAVGDWMIAEGWLIIDPDTYTDMWGDRMLLRYATQLIKQQWGNNMKKYQGIQLIGGVEMSGQQIYDEATAELEKLELEIRQVHEEPPMFFMG